MKWRRRHVSPPSSSFTHLKPTRLRLVLAQQPLREGPTPYCRQFWSNICPRKNKSPLSLTTGRASLVSNRALLNRRRITDLREVGPFRLLSAPSFRSRSTSSPLSPLPPSSAHIQRGWFFFHRNTEPHKPDMIRSCPFLSAFDFYRKLRRIFTVVISFSFPFSPRDRSSATISLGLGAIKISRSYGRMRNIVVGAIVLSEIRVSRRCGLVSLPATVTLPLKNEKLHERKNSTKKHRASNVESTFWIVKGRRNRFLSRIFTLWSMKKFSDTSESVEKFVFSVCVNDRSVFKQNIKRQRDLQRQYLM